MRPRRRKRGAKGAARLPPRQFRRRKRDEIRRVVTQAQLQAALADARQLHHLPSLNSSRRSEEHTSELQSLMRKSHAVSCLKKINLQHLDCMHFPLTSRLSSHLDFQLITVTKTQLYHYQ